MSKELADRLEELKRWLLESYTVLDSKHVQNTFDEAIAALRAEPVAWRQWESEHGWWIYYESEQPNSQPLYAAPSREDQRKTGVPGEHPDRKNLPMSRAMTEAFAIKGSDGVIEANTTEDKEDQAWSIFLIDKYNDDRTRWTKEQAIEEGYTCVPVTVSEKGEADELLPGLELAKEILQKNNFKSYVVIERQIAQFKTHLSRKEQKWSEDEISAAKERASKRRDWFMTNAPKEPK